MQSAPLPDNEDARLAELKSYCVLDTEPEQQFDALTELASSILNMPIALVSLIDEERQWFKSHHGIDVSETPREFAFCSHTILQTDVFEVTDSREDERFFDNPLVAGEPKVIFYAGAPLITSEGNNLGTLCVIDHEPHQFSDENKRQLQIIADQVISQLQLRKQLILQTENLSELLSLTQDVNLKNKELNRINKELKGFTAAASHDLKAPLIGIDQLANMIEQDIKNDQLAELPQGIGMIRQRTKRLNLLLDDLLAYAYVGHERAIIEQVDTKELVAELFMLSAPEGFKLKIKSELPILVTHKSPLQQVLQNLITNAIKHHHLAEGCVSVSCEESETRYTFAIQDDGPGIDPLFHEHIFGMFKRLKTRDEVEGSGIGLSMVQKIVENYNGEVSIESELNKGSTFYFSWPKLV